MQNADVKASYLKTRRPAVLPGISSVVMVIWRFVRPDAVRTKGSPV